ncbi:MAG: hypothetical protein IPG78_18850 [Ignavibacteria bacterium]|nr:hypothetical protein [Ignavibacteria bacterium]
METKEYFISDFIKIILEYRKKVIIFTLIGFVLSIVLFFFVLDPIFYSSGTVKTISSKLDLGGLISSGIPDIGDLGDIAGSSGVAKELALYETIIGSRRCLEETIVKFNIMEENEYKFMQDAVKDFRENVMEIKKDKVAGTLEIGIYDKNPQKAKEMSEFLIYQLNKINSELNIQNAKNNREFIEKRYDQAKIDLKRTEDTLEYFQNIYGISPDYQVQASLKANIELESEIKSEQIKLELLSKILSPDQPEIQTQMEKIKVLKEQLNTLETSPFEESNLNMKGSPRIVLNFLRLKRDLEIQNKILTTLIPILEQSKIQEKKDTPSVLVIDNPALPEKKTKPKRVINILFFTFLFFLLSSSYFISKNRVYNYINRLRN